MESVGIVVLWIISFVVLTLEVKSRRDLRLTYSNITNLQSQTQTTSVLAQIESQYNDLNKWMNEFLEQLVRDLTNAYSRSQECLVSVYHLAPQISEAFSVFLVAGEQMLIKQQLLIHLNCLCSVSLPISVFFMHSLHDVLHKGQGTVSKRPALKPVSKQRHQRQTSEPKSTLILTGGPSLWPFCTSVQGGYSRIRCSTVCKTARYPRMLQKF